jgi:hypothetical protein
MMDTKPDEMSEALMRRRQGFAQKSMSPAKGKMGGANIGSEMATADESEILNHGGGEVAPAGAAPESMSMQANGDASAITPEMFMELMGTKNGNGLRGRVMQNAADMKKNC